MLAFGLICLIFGIVNILNLIFLSKIENAEVKEAEFIRYTFNELGQYLHIEYRFRDERGFDHTNREHLGYYPGVFNNYMLDSIKKEGTVLVRILGKRAMIAIRPIIEKYKQNNNEQHLFELDLE